MAIDTVIDTAIEMLDRLQAMAVVPVARYSVHEFTPVAMLALNPSIRNSPGWLWETVLSLSVADFHQPWYGFLKAKNGVPTTA